MCLSLKSAKAGLLSTRGPRVLGLCFIIAAKSPVLPCQLDRKNLGYRIGWGWRDKKGHEEKSDTQGALREKFTGFRWSRAFSFKPSSGPLQDLELSWVLNIHSAGGRGGRVRKDGCVYICPTCTLDSGKLIFSATSSRMKISGYRVFANNASSTSSCARVNVVLSRRCFRGVAAGQEAQGPLGCGSSFSVTRGLCGCPTPATPTPQRSPGPRISSTRPLPVSSPPPPGLGSSGRPCPLQGMPHSA